MFAEERKRYNSGLLPTKYNFFDETKYNRISLVDEINPKVNPMQTTSFELQQKYYEELVAQHPQWVLVKIYADEGK